MPKTNVRYVCSNWEQFLKKSVSELLLALHLRGKQAPKEVLEILIISSPRVRFTCFFSAANKNLLNRSSLGQVISNHAYEVYQII